MGSIQKTLRIGVDVRGTNTDAVVLDPSLSNYPNRGVLALHKTPSTSPNVTDGIETAVRSVLEQSKMDRNSISCPTIGTVPRYFALSTIHGDCFSS
jgi:N-methylhydantoinase A/oxoprolinase/acetone carboxylase beta subunit